MSDKVVGDHLSIFIKCSTRATMEKAIGVQDDFQECLESLIQDPIERLKIMDQVSFYREVRGHFFKTMPSSTLQTMDPCKSLSHSKFRL